MKKQFLQLGVRIDQKLNRSEKTVALPLELERIEETVSTYKQVCTVVQKKLLEYFPSAGKGTDGQSVDKRLKRTADFLLGQSLIEQGRVLSKQQNSTCLGQVLLTAGGVCTSIGSHLVQYEISVEQLVLQQLDTVLKTDLPAITKQRKNLDQLILELDTAKARLADAQAEERKAGVISGSGKVEKCVEDLDDMDRKVEQARDTLATDMMTFLAKDAELAGMIAKFLNYKLEYHTSLVDQMKLTEPKIDSILDFKRGYPIFGTSLSSHLTSFNLPSGIAYPIQVCVSRLVALGIEEEGLFRLAAGSSKVKRLKAELETPGLPGLLSLEAADHHVLTAIIKSYLRELPEPLFGGSLYQDWLEAGRCEDAAERAEAVFNCLQHDNLPREHFRNIQYLFKFLHEVSLLEDRNKMSASNLAIVITPNVIWDCEGVSDTMDVAVSASLARAVEAIISQYSWFFQNDASHFPSWDHQLPDSLACRATPLPDSSHLATPSYTPARSRAHTSPQPNTRDRKNKVKKAPPPPGGGEAGPGSPASSPSHGRNLGTAQHRHSGSGADSFGPRAPAAEDSCSVPGVRGGGGHRKTQSMDTNLETKAASPTLPSPPPIGWRLESPGKDACKDNSRDSSEPKDSKDPATAPFPVPAPRTIKPALPNKPEGISRNASMRTVDHPVRILMDKESTNL